MAAALAVAGCSATAPPETAPPETALRFDWPDGVSADVEAERSRSFGSAEAEPPLVLVFAFTAERDAAGLSVDFADAQSPADAGSDPARVLDGGDLAAALPGLRISPAGDVVEVVDAAARASELRDSIQARIRTAPRGRRAALRRRLAPLLDTDRTARVITDTGRDRWRSWVGLWKGRVLSPGSVARETHSVPVDLVGGLSVQMHAELKAVGPAACGAHLAAGCVELELVQTTDAEDAARALAEWTRQSGPRPAAAPRVVAFEITTRVRLVTEPATLLPHSLARTRITRFRVRAGHEELERESRTERRERYRYR